MKKQTKVGKETSKNKDCYELNEQKGYMLLIVQVISIGRRIMKL